MLSQVARTCACLSVDDLLGERSWHAAGTITCYMAMSTPSIGLIPLYTFWTALQGMLTLLSVCERDLLTTGHRLHCLVRPQHRPHTSVRRVDSITGPVDPAHSV